MPGAILHDLTHQSGPNARRGTSNPNRLIANVRSSAGRPHDSVVHVQGWIGIQAVPQQGHNHDGQDAIVRECRSKRRGRRQCLRGLVGYHAVDGCRAARRYQSINQHSKRILLYLKVRRSKYEYVLQRVYAKLSMEADDDDDT